MVQTKNALLSVYNKEGLEDLAVGLQEELGWNLYASGGTARQIKEAGIPVTDVAELVGGKAILGHRVVTLSREVHAGLLAAPRIDMHIEELEALGIPFLGLVAVDMYPLKAAISAGLSEAEVTEMTDIGGPTMLRSAAKGRRIVLSRPEQRPVVLDWLREDRPDEENVVRTLAAMAEQEVMDYVRQSAEYIGSLVRQTVPQSSYDQELRKGLAFYLHRWEPSSSWGIGLDNG